MEIGACTKASCESLKRLFEIQTSVRGKIMSLPKEGLTRAAVRHRRFAGLPRAGVWKFMIFETLESMF
jgi:hypothetical protein